MRPLLLRPPFFGSGPVRDFSGDVRVTSEKSATLEPRRPLVVGFCLRIVIVFGPQPIRLNGVLSAAFLLFLLISVCCSGAHWGAVKMSMLWPAATLTTARLEFLRLPSPVRVRLTLPTRLSVFTAVTVTSKIDSTAILIWV